MKPTYRIMFNHQEPSDAEVARWQNFDQLVDDYQAVYYHRRRGRRWTYGSLLATALILIGGVGYYYIATPSTLPLPAPVASVPPSAEHRLPAINRPTLATVSLTIVTPPVATSGQSGTSSPPLKQPPTDDGKLVEAQPAGGYPALYDYFATQLRYPEAARQAGVFGSVLMEFTIDVDGRPTQIRVAQGIDEALDQEAIRLVEEMPTWSPATVDGQPIATRHTMPLMFQLTNP